MNNLTDFIRWELEPALYDNIDRAFPDMGFKLKGRKWISSKHLDGSESSDGEGSYISETYSNRIADRNGSRSLSLVDFQLERMGYSSGATGAQLIDALRALCGVCGLTLPETDSREYQERREREEALLSVSLKMQGALWTEAGADTLRYLKEERGYSEELIKKMGLGCLTPETEAALKNIKYRDKDGKERSLLSDIRYKDGEEIKYYKPVSDYYRLAIPYIAGGHIRGMKLRSLGDKTLPNGAKPAKYHNTNGAGLKAELFGLSGLRLTTDRDIVIVEGELDCLHSQAEGLSYVVSAAGGTISPEAIQSLRRKGADKITLLFDTPERGSKDEEETPQKIETALRLIREAGLRGYVAHFPERQDGKKVDADSYLQEHSVEELKRIIEEADTEVFFLFERELKAAGLREKQTGEPTLKNFERLKKATIKLSNMEGITPTDRRLLFNYFSAATGGGISPEDVQEEADTLRRAQEIELRDAQAKQRVSQIQELITAGKTEEAILLMKETGGQLSRIDKEPEYSRYLEDRTEQLWEEYKIKPRGLQTNIELRSPDKKNRYRLTLPSGAITIVGGTTGGGKSKTLQSLAIDAATNGEPGSVLYITYEENEKNVNRQLLNAYCNIELTKETAHFGNEQTLQEYLYNGSTRFIKDSAFAAFEQRLSEFKELRRNSLKLIKPEDNHLETLLGLLRYASSPKSGLTIKAVFIDYVQELYIEALKRNTGRVDELKEIMVEIDLIAQRRDFPVVMGAQLKRETASPLSMTNQDIADSGWIERKASEILLLWSSLEHTKNDTDGDVKRELPELRIGEGGRLYAKLTKSRFIPKNSDAILPINGNTGRVSGNSQESTAQSPQPQTEAEREYNTGLFDK